MSFSFTSVLLRCGVHVPYLVNRPHWRPWRTLYTRVRRIQDGTRTLKLDPSSQDDLEEKRPLGHPQWHSHPRNERPIMWDSDPALRYDPKTTNDYTIPAPPPRQPTSRLGPPQDFRKASAFRGPGAAIPWVWTAPSPNPPRRPLLLPRHQPPPPPPLLCPLPRHHRRRRHNSRRGRYPPTSPGC